MRRHALTWNSKADLHRRGSRGRRTVDNALEFAEERLLSGYALRQAGPPEVPLLDQSLCRNFGPEEMELLQVLLAEEHYRAAP